MVDTSGIHRIIGKARARLKAQAALETATLATISASVLALCVIFTMRHHILTTTEGVWLLVGCGGLVAVGAILGAVRRFPTPLVATRIDRASGLSDRLANACAFERRLAKSADEPPETVAMMRAAVADATRHAPRANVKAATPFSAPRDSRAAIAFAVISAAVAGLYWPEEDQCFGAVAVPSPSSQVANLQVDNPVLIGDDDLEYTRDLLDDLRHTAQDDRDPTLQEFADKVEHLLDKAELGELSKEELLEELAKAEQEYNKGADEHVEETLADLKQTGKELEKSKLTKELGKALEKGDLEKAQQELEKLAQQLANDELSEKDRKEVAKALDKVSDKFDKKEQKHDKQLDKQIADAKKDIEKLKRRFDKTKDGPQKQKLARRMKNKKRELKQLQREKEQRKKSASRRQLKSLHRNLKNAAQEMRKKNQTQKSRRQASRKMKAASQNLGRVSQDARKVRTQRKVASQLTDLKEALRRAKQKGNRGPKDLFGRNQKNRDFNRRARGGQGSKGAWKPGSGQRGRLAKGGKGQGQNGKQPGSNGQQPGGDSWGTEHDPNLMGDPTGKSGDTVDKSVEGIHGRGPSKRETVLAAAQKGFATRQYQKVYAAYKAIVEEVMHTEKVPAGYKYYIKRYFQKIKPHAMD